MNEPLKFYLDEHVHPAVADGLRRRSIDVVTTLEAGMLGATDPEHLEFARIEGRLIFTQDADFLRLNAQGIKHAGIAYARRQTSVGHIVRGLVLIHEVLSPSEMQNRVEFL